MHDGLNKVWGYKSDGDARLFLVPAGGKLPAGWSPDISVMPLELRDGDKICERAGTTVQFPELVGNIVEPVREHWKTRAKREREEAEAAAKPLRYDENLRQVID